MRRLGGKLLAILGLGMLFTNHRADNNNFNSNNEAIFQNPVKMVSINGFKPKDAKHYAEKLKKQRRLGKIAHESRRINYQNN